MSEKQKTKEEQLITKDMMLGELVQKYPEAAMVMAEAGMHCIGCGMAAMETIEQGCMAHGLKDEDIDELVAKMNKLASEKKEDKDQE